MKAIEVALNKEKDNGKYANGEESIRSLYCPKDYKISVPNHTLCNGEDTLKKHCRECWNQEV